MKKIIKNRVYDTDTANLVYRWEVKGEGFTAVEALYHKRGGTAREYFLYLSSSVLDWEPNENITPLTFDAAQIWGEEHMPPAEYEQHFEGQVQTDGRTRRIFQLTESCLQKLKNLSTQRGLSMSDVIEELIDQRG